MREALSPEAALAAAGEIVEFEPPVYPSGSSAKVGDSTNHLKLFTVADILALPRRSYLLKGLIAPGEMSVWWGPPKCGKSFLVMHVAYGMAQGRDVFGRRVKQCRVLYLACEGQAGLRNRVQALVNRYGTTDNFMAIAQPLHLLGADDTDALIATINQSFDVVVVDTLNRVIAGGDENSSADMGALIRNLDLVRDKTSAHVLVIHHGVKGSDNKGRGPRGHGSLIGAADAIIEVSVGDGGIRSASPTDVKDDASGYTMGFVLKVVELDKDEDGDPITTCLIEEQGPDEKRPQGERLTAIEGAWMADLNEMFGTFAAKEMVPAPGEGRYLTLTRDEVREGFRVRGRFTLTPDGKLTGADREKMSARLNALKNKGKIGLSADYVWQL
jgi:hypothetical protein